MATRFETDSSGKVPTFALASYTLTLAPALGEVLLLRVDFAEDLAALQAERFHQVTFALSPAQALSIADGLQKAAEKLQALPPPGGHVN